MMRLLHWLWCWLIRGRAPNPSAKIESNQEKGPVQVPVEVAVTGHEQWQKVWYPRLRPWVPLIVAMLIIVPYLVYTRFFMLAHNVDMIGFLVGRKDLPDSFGLIGKSVGAIGFDTFYFACGAVALETLHTIYTDNHLKRRNLVELLTRTYLRMLYVPSITAIVMMSLSVFSVDVIPGMSFGVGNPYELTFLMTFILAYNSERVVKILERIQNAVLGRGLLADECPCRNCVNTQCPVKTLLQ